MAIIWHSTSSSSLASGSRSLSIPASPTAQAGDIAVISAWGAVEHESSDGSLDMATSGWVRIGSHLSVVGLDPSTTVDWTVHQGLWWKVLDVGDVSSTVTVNLGADYGAPAWATGMSLVLARGAVPVAATFSEDTHDATPAGGLVVLDQPVSAVPVTPAVAVTYTTGFAGAVNALNGWSAMVSRSGSRSRHHAARKEISSGSDTSPSLNMGYPATNDGRVATTVVFGELLRTAGWSIGTLRFGGGGGWR